MTPEEALEAVKAILQAYLNCEIQRENEKHGDQIVLAEIPVQNYFYNLLDLPNTERFINLELADAPAEDETSEIEIDLSFPIAGHDDYIRALRYQQALRRVLKNHGCDDNLNLKLEGKSLNGYLSGSLKRYLVSYRVSTTTFH